MNKVKEEDKIDKAVVGYIYKPGQNYTCSNCLYQNGQYCKLYSRSEKISLTEGSCNLFMLGRENSEIPTIAKTTKVETGYMENNQGFSCKRCEEFDSKAQSCHKINKNSVGNTPGIISPDACCNHWKSDPIRSKLTDKELSKIN